jgi:hypothetical protein
VVEWFARGRSWAAAAPKRRARVFETVVAGFLTFVLGETFLKLVVEPVQSFKTTVGQIANSLIRFANRLSGTAPQDEALEIRQHFRQLSSQLSTSYYLVPLYDVTRFLFGLPSRSDVHEAAAKLIGISNMILDASSTFESAFLQTEVCDHLGIFVRPGNRATRPPSKPAA